MEVGLSAEETGGCSLVERIALCIGRAAKLTRLLMRDKWLELTAFATQALLYKKRQMISTLWLMLLCYVEMQGQKEREREWDTQTDIQTERLRQWHSSHALQANPWERYFLLLDIIFITRYLQWFVFRCFFAHENVLFAFQFWMIQLWVTFSFRCSECSTNDLDTARCS